MKDFHNNNLRNVNTSFPNNGVNLEADIDVYEKAIEILKTVKIKTTKHENTRRKAKTN